MLDRVLSGDAGSRFWKRTSAHLLNEVIVLARGNAVVVSGERRPNYRARELA
jgi:hypothetical protein